MQASCKQNSNESFHILRLMNFIRMVHQIGGVLYNPTTTKHGQETWWVLIEYSWYDQFPKGHMSCYHGQARLIVATQYIFLLVFDNFVTSF